LTFHLGRDGNLKEELRKIRSNFDVTLISLNCIKCVVNSEQWTRLGNNRSLLLLAIIEVATTHWESPAINYNKEDIHFVNINLPLKMREMSVTIL